MNDKDLKRLLDIREGNRVRAGWRCPDEMQLAAYVEHRVSGSERARIESHVAKCAACLDQIAFLANQPVADETPVAQYLLSRAKGLVPSKRVIWPTLVLRWGTVAAAATCLVLVVALSFFRAAPSVQQRPTARPGADTARGGTGAAPAPSATGPAAPTAQQTAGSSIQPQTPPSAATATPGRVTRPSDHATQPAPPVVALSVLARVEPPAYIPVALRGPRDEAAERFDAAMRHYVKRNYEAALPELDAAATLSPDAPRVTFFLAICQLLTGRLDAAIMGLQKTVAHGESPYVEEAHFYLAKARLQQGDIQAARDELKRTIEKHGRLEADARRLLDQLDLLPPAK